MRPISSDEDSIEEEIETSQTNIKIQKQSRKGNTGDDSIEILKRLPNHKPPLGKSPFSS
jgi:hypothetical protein